MTQLPIWAVYVVAFGTPLCALAGVLISQWLARRPALEAGESSVTSLPETLLWTYR